MSEAYSWFGMLNPTQFSKAYNSHQVLVQQKRAYRKKCKNKNRKWQKWYFKSLMEVKNNG